MHPDQTFLIIGARARNLLHRGRVLVAFQVDLLISAVRKAETLSLVKTDWVKLASYFVGVGRRRVYPFSDDESLLVSKAEASEILRIQGSGKELHLSIVINSDLGEPVCLRERPHCVTVSQSVH